MENIIYKNPRSNSIQISTNKSCITLPKISAMATLSIAKCFWKRPIRTWILERIQNPTAAIPIPIFTLSEYGNIKETKKADPKIKKPATNLSVKALFIIFSSFAPSREISRTTIE